MSTKKGFFMVANEIVMHYLPQLGAVGFMLYCTLRRMTDRNDRCYPTLYTLTRLTGIEEAQLKVELERLEALQLMQRFRHINSLDGKEREVYQLPLYPECLGSEDGEHATEPGAQLSLHLPEDLIIPKVPPITEIAVQSKRVDDPPKEPQMETLVSLMTLLVEQMHETGGQMSTLIQRMDHIVEQFPKVNRS